MQVLAEISLVAAAKHQRMVKQQAVAIITVTKKKAHQKNGFHLQPEPDTNGLEP